MELAIGYTGAVIIGVLLGLLGGGGSILAVPILVYFFGESPIYATSYSLFIVGAASLTGSLACMRQGLVSYRTALVFGIPSITGVFLTRKYLIPALPDALTIYGFSFSKEAGIMLLFSLLMLLAALPMISERIFRVTRKKKIIGYNYPLILTEGLIVGVLTGIIGAGGGFLIIPALILLSDIPVKTAVGTSLLIIALKSLIGFTGDIGNLNIDWGFLLGFTGMAMIGIISGNYLSGFVPSEKLKPAFGWFVIVMGVYIIGKEIFV